MIALYNYLYVTLSTGSKDLLHPVLAGGIRTARNRVLLVVTVGVRFLSLLLEGGVLTDGSVGLGVQGLQVVRSKVSLEVLAEVSTVFLLILLLHEPHVADYMRLMKEEDEEKYSAHFSKYLKANLGPDDLESLYTKAHAAIRENPAFEKKAEEANPNRDHKKYSIPRRSYAARKNRVKQILAARA